jgi:hypothetical protein
MKLLRYVISFLAFSLLGTSLLFADHFIDDFDRADGEVGNDWEEINDGGLNITIKSKQLQIKGNQAGDWASNSIKRDVTDLGEFKSAYALTKSNVLHPELFIENMNTKGYIAVSAGHGWHFVYTVSPAGGWTGWLDPPSKIVLGEDWVELGIIQTSKGIYKIVINDEVIVEGVEALDEVTHVRVNADMEAGKVDTMLIEYVEVNREDAPKQAVMPMDKLTISWGEIKAGF